jgi:large subunit ribosomal protein L25
MSDRASLAAEPREVVGKKVKQLRKDGFIPAIVYGRREPKSIQLPTTETMRVLRRVGRTNLIEVNLPNEKYTVLARDIQQHPTRGDVLHIDFYEVDLKEIISVEVDLILEGISEPEKEGLGRVSLVGKTITIEARPDDLVAELIVDATMIAKVDETITAADIVLPEGIALGVEEDRVVARFVFNRSEEEEEDLDDADGLQALVTEEEDEEDEDED